MKFIWIFIFSYWLCFSCQPSCFLQLLFSLCTSLLNAWISPNFTNLSLGVSLTLTGASVIMEENTTEQATRLLNVIFLNSHLLAAQQDFPPISISSVPNCYYVESHSFLKSVFLSSLLGFCSSKPRSFPAAKRKLTMVTILFHKEYKFHGGRKLDLSCSIPSTQTNNL